VEREDRPPHPSTHQKSRRKDAIEITRVNGLRRDVVHWSDKTTTRYWRPGNLRAVLVEGRSGTPVRAFRLTYYEDQQFDEAAFSWIGPETFAGMKVHSGIECRYYRKTIRISEEQTWELEAWIDPATGRPRALNNGRYRAVFDFSDEPPAEPIIMPAHVQKELKRNEAFLAPRKMRKRR
jgi:hypothetical protein